MTTPFALIRFALLALLAVGVFLPLGACAPSARETSIRDQGKLNDAKGDSDPAGHPGDRGNALVKWYQTRLCVIGLLAIVALGAGIGLYFTPLSYFGTFAAPIAGFIAATCVVVGIALSYWPYMVGAGVLIVGYEVYTQLKSKSTSSATTSTTSGILGTIESAVEGLFSEIYSFVTGHQTSPTQTPASPAAAGNPANAATPASAAKPA